MRRKEKRRRKRPPAAGGMVPGPPATGKTFKGFATLVGTVVGSRPGQPGEALDVGHRCSGGRRTKRPENRKRPTKKTTPDRLRIASALGGFFRRNLFRQAIYPFAIFGRAKAKIVRNAGRRQQIAGLPARLINSGSRISGLDNETASQTPSATRCRAASKDRMPPTRIKGRSTAALIRPAAALK